jgi:hypothetical protein
MLMASALESFPSFLKCKNTKQNCGLSFFPDLEKQEVFIGKDLWSLEIWKHMYVSYSC